MLRACRRSFCRQPGSKPSNRTRRRCNGFLLNVPCASHLPSVAEVWRNGQTYLRHAELRTNFGRTRAYVITKWRQSEIQQVKETKVPPPRTHGKVGDPVGGQCSGVRENPTCKVGAAVAAEHALSPNPSMDNGSFRACLSLVVCALPASRRAGTYHLPKRRLRGATCPISRLIVQVESTSVE